MGSSAGAGSGEFHVYRHLRRKEYARQKYLKMQSETERLNEEFKDRMEENQKKADDKTNKKRAKRMKVTYLENSCNSILVTETLLLTLIKIAFFVEKAESQSERQESEEE